VRAIGKTLGIGTGTVQRVVMEQSRLFDVDVTEAAVWGWRRRLRNI
jgi:hypothetical protein